MRPPAATRVRGARATRDCWYCTREPNDLRRRAVASDQGDEVGVLREHDGTGVASGLEDDRILGVAQLQVPHGQCGDAEGLAEPAGERRRELGVDPDDHGRRARPGRAALRGKDRMV